MLTTTITMPASFAVVNEEEMAYTTGGCFISGIIAGSIADWLLARGATVNLGIDMKIIMVNSVYPHSMYSLYTYDGESYYDPKLGEDSYVHYDGENYWAGSKESIYYKLGAPFRNYCNMLSGFRSRMLFSSLRGMSGVLSFFGL